MAGGCGGSDQGPNRSERLIPRAQILLNLRVSCKFLVLSFSCWGLHGGDGGDSGAVVLGVASVFPMPCFFF